MHREVRFLSLSFLISSLAACGGVAGDASEAKADAEVVGTVKLREGDCMPVTTPERCRIRGLATRVEAYRVLRVEEGATGVSFVVPPNAKPVRTTTSGEDGRFSLVLPEGRYSILASYEGSWYPTAETGDGEWAPVEVNAGWQEDVELLINRATD